MLSAALLFVFAIAAGCAGQQLPFPLDEDSPLAPLSAEERCAAQRELADFDIGKGAPLLCRADHIGSLLRPKKLRDAFQAVKNAPPQVAIGVHVCRGNYKGMYLSEGGYDSVAEKFFGRANVNHFLLEFDTPRAGGFAPLRFVPRNKGVVLGLVSSKTPQLEKIDVLKRRTEEARSTSTCPGSPSARNAGSPAPWAGIR